MSGGYQNLPPIMSDAGYCRGKRAWPSKKQANGMVRTMVKHGSNAATLNAYKCRDCHGWHLGNRPGGARGR